MKSYSIGLLSVVILLLGSIIYKQQNNIVSYHFPIPETSGVKSKEVPLYLFLFFSKNDCISCLQEIVEVLNSLPPYFCISGIVPEDELKNEQELRRLTGVSFPLFSNLRYRKYLPWHTPTIFGVSKAGKIIFILPGIQGQRNCLESTLLSIYGKLYPLLEKEGNSEKKHDNKKR